VAAYFLDDQEFSISCPFNGINDGISEIFPFLQRFLVSATRGEVTNLLLELKQGNKEAEGRLIPLVYKELRRIAAIHLRREAPDHSLQPTALVHEAYLRLTDIKEIDWQSRSHFFAVSATLMRRILVDHARASHARKRGNGWDALSLNEAILPSPERAPEILALDAALKKLAAFDERQSKIVELRFFAGMSEDEAGGVLGISTRTVKRDWRVAKAWLYKELSC
jgi:RNA polymerase sigma factor (TIGR02999 family)